MFPAVVKLRRSVVSAVNIQAMVRGWLDRSLVRMYLWGGVCLVVHSASGIQNRAYVGEQDPYVRAWLAEASAVERLDDLSKLVAPGEEGANVGEGGREAPAKEDKGKDDNDNRNIDRTSNGKASVLIANKLQRTEILEGGGTEPVWDATSATKPMQNVFMFPFLQKYGIATRDEVVRFRCPVVCMQAMAASMVYDELLGSLITAVPLVRKSQVCKKIA